MKILVTGGAGFIGSNFIFYFLKKYPHYQIVCLDTLTYAGNLSTLQSILNHPQFTFIKEDITQQDQINQIFEQEKFDMVINFAAETHVDRSILDASAFLKTNIIGTQILLDASLKNHVKRFHQVSTDEVYGDLPLDRPDLLFSESSSLKPSSPYAASKCAADLLVLSYYRTFHAPVTISRCSNNYGPYQFPEKLIPLMITHAMNDQMCPVYGEGKNIRDWLYVEDHCIALDQILHFGKNGEVYNIGGNTEKNNLEVVSSILNQLNKPQSLIHFVKDRPGHDLRYAIDATKIEQELGWYPKTNFDEGIKQTVMWYQTHPLWWQAILSNDYQSFYKNFVEN